VNRTTETGIFDLVKKPGFYQKLGFSISPKELYRLRLLGIDLTDIAAEGAEIEKREMNNYDTNRFDIICRPSCVNPILFVMQDLRSIFRFLINITNPKSQIARCPMPYALCPMPYALSPNRHLPAATITRRGNSDVALD
jgi:hypothetical protein